MKKIKAALTFIDLDNNETNVITIINDTKQDLDVSISSIINDHVNSGKFIKSVEYSDVNYVNEIDWSSFTTVLTSEEVLKYIVMNKVHLIPETETWINSSNKIMGITHKVIIGNKKYSGLTVPEAINLHVNTIDISGE